MIVLFPDLRELRKLATAIYAVSIPYLPRLVSRTVLLYFLRQNIKVLLTIGLQKWSWEYIFRINLENRLLGKTISEIKLQDFCVAQV